MNPGIGIFLIGQVVMVNWEACYQLSVAYKF